MVQSGPARGSPSFRSPTIAQYLKEAAVRRGADPEVLVTNQPILPSRLVWGRGCMPVESFSRTFRRYLVSMIQDACPCNPLVSSGTSGKCASSDSLSEVRVYRTVHCGTSRRLRPWRARRRLCKDLGSRLPCLWAAPIGAARATPRSRLEVPPVLPMHVTWACLSTRAQVCVMRARECGCLNVTR